MKKMLLSALLLFSILSTAQHSKALNLPETGMSNESIEKLIESGTLTEAQENKLIDYLESNDEDVDPGSIGEINIEEIRDFEKYKAERDQKGDWNNISGDLGLTKLQDASVGQVVGKGKWAFDLVFIDKKGKRTQLAAYNNFVALKPASTMKVFTAWSSYRRGSYPLSTMSHMLKWSSNIEADAALRTVADKEKQFVIPKDSYVNQLIGYSMMMKGRKYTIDAKVAKGCAIMKNDYSGLIDSQKFHPVNGSGLQQSSKDKLIHENKVTARLQISLLNSIYKSGHYDTFKKLLATPGGAGTLRNNFKTLRKSAKIYAKTGTLGNAKTLAGFVEIPKGTIMFSVIGNDLRGVDSPSEALSGPIENIIYLNAKYAQDSL